MWIYPFLRGMAWASIAHGAMLGFFPWPYLNSCGLHFADFVSVRLMTARLRLFCAFVHARQVHGSHQLHNRLGGRGMLAGFSWQTYDDLWQTRRGLMTLVIGKAGMQSIMFGFWRL